MPPTVECRGQMCVMVSGIESRVASPPGTNRGGLPMHAMRRRGHLGLRLLGGCVRVWEVPSR
jgi:hypothetical protein